MNKERLSVRLMRFSQSADGKDDVVFFDRQTIFEFSVNDNEEGKKRLTEFVNLYFSGPEVGQ